MKNRLTVKETSELLGVSQQFVREGLKRNRLPIGCAVKMSGKWTYHISPGLLQAYMNPATIKEGG